jgi:hypothetical protein
MACHQKDEHAQRTARLKATAAMEQKVNEVINQLRKDCDSSLLSLARYQADSIQQAASKKPSRNRKRAK